MSSTKFTNEGIILFFDVLIIGAGNWIFWLIISRFSTTTEVGEATSIISLVLMTTTLIQFGLEYPILKFAEKSKILTTSILIELSILIAAIPIIIFSLNNIFPDTSTNITYVVIAILFFSLVGFVSRYSLLGISKVKTVLIIDSIGTSVKFLTGYLFVSMDYGLIGILIPFVLIQITICVFALIVARKSFEFKIAKLEEIKLILRSGLSNAPAKLSRTTILTLVVVLLASFGVAKSDIGIFYIALMISYVAGGALSLSLSLMVIPASSKLNVDLSLHSLKMGISLTIPIIVALLVVPSEILSLVGQAYSEGSNVLFILALGILPFTVMLNAISKLNNQGRHKELIVLGIIQLSTFIVAFLVLVNEYQTLGAAYSILIGFLACSIPSLIWLGRKILKFLSISILAIFLGWVLGYVTYYVIELHAIITAFSSIGISLAIIFSLKAISITDVKEILKNSFGKK